MFFLAIRFLLLGVGTVVLSLRGMDNEKNSSTTHTRPRLIFTSSTEVLSTSESVPQSSIQMPQLSNELFENNKIEELKIMFEAAPQRAKNIVKMLQNPGSLQTGKFKYMFFVGAPGTGKTTTAQAIAYKMVIESGWGYKFMTATDIVGGFRNQAAERLRNMLQVIREQIVPMILIIDELNK